MMEELMAAIEKRLADLEYVFLSVVETRVRPRFDQEKIEDVAKRFRELDVLAAKAR